MSHMSREFSDLVKAVGDCKSKQEEDKIILKEVHTLRARLGEKDSGSRMKELCVRMMYCEMLGHPVEFGYIHAINMTQRMTLVEKKTGYLAATLFLEQGSEFLILLVNTLQRDLKSQNPWEVCAALTAVTKLIDAETIPAVVALVKECFSHSNEQVRKRAVMALHRFLQKDPDTVPDYQDLFRRAICDRDPSVMSAALCVIHDVAKSNPTAYHNMVPSLVSIIKQVVEHRLPREFDYHRMPAPWIQIKLLKILALLGTANQKASEEMYEVLQDVMKKGDVGTSIGCAVMYECVRTITKIYPHARLLELAAASTSRFITSENPNLKYIGVDALSAIVQVSPKFASEHQMVVIDCLEDNDDTLRRKTLDLLYKMTNPHNVEVVVDRMMAFLTPKFDNFLKKDLVGKITSLAEKFAPSNSWFISTMNGVFEKGGQLVEPDASHNLMRLVAEGTGEDEVADHELRMYACESYLGLLEAPKVSDVLVQVGVWVLGEYSYLLAPKGITSERVQDLLCGLLERENFESASTKCFIVSAITKLQPLCTALQTRVHTLMMKYATSKDPQLQLRCIEFLQLARQPALMRAVLPLDASCEDIEVDASLPCLSALVAGALASGGKRYLKPHERPERWSGGEGNFSQRMAAAQSQSTAKLRFDAYAPYVPPSKKAEVAPPPAVAAARAPSPEAPPAPAKPSFGSNLFAGLGDAVPAPAPSNQAAHLAHAPEADTLSLTGAGPKKWGAAGYTGTQPQAAPPVLASAIPKTQNEPASAAAQSSTAAAAGNVSGLFATEAAARPAPQPNQPGAPPAPIQVAPRVDPKKEAEERHKKQLAASLFGGVGAVGAAEAPTPPPAHVSKPAAPAVASTHKPPQADLLDLDLLGSNPRPAHAAPVHDLLSSSDAGSQYNGAASQGSGSIYSSTAQGQDGNKAGSIYGSTGLSVQGGSIYGSAGPAGAGNLVGVSDASKWVLPPGLANVVAGLVRSSSAPCVVASSSNVHVAAMSAVKDDTVILIVQFHSPQHFLSDLTAEYLLPPSVVGTCNAEANSRSFTGTKAIIATLDPQAAAATHRITLALRGIPTPQQPLRVCVRSSFYDIPSMTAVKEDIHIPAHIVGFQSWSGHPCERKGELRDMSIQSTDDYVMKAKSCMNMNCVKVIGAEVICAASLTSLGLVLLHARVGQPGASTIPPTTYTFLPPEGISWRAAVGKGNV